MRLSSYCIFIWMPQIAIRPVHIRAKYGRGSSPQRVIRQVLNQCSESFLTRATRVLLITGGHKQSDLLLCRWARLCGGTEGERDSTAAGWYAVIKPASERLNGFTGNAHVKKKKIPQNSDKYSNAVGGGGWTWLVTETNWRNYYFFVPQHTHTQTHTSSLDFIRHTQSCTSASVFVDSADCVYTDAIGSKKVPGSIPSRLSTLITSAEEPHCADVSRAKNLDYWQNRCAG